MRNRDAVTQPCRAQFLACYEAVQDLRFRKALAARKQRGDPLEQTRLVRHVDIQLDVIHTQQLANWIHRANLLAFDTAGVRHRHTSRGGLLCILVVSFARLVKVDDIRV